MSRSLTTPLLHPPCSSPGLFLQTQTTNELSVDGSRANDPLEIILDFTFHAINCDVVTLDTMDVSGELHLDTFRDVYKVRLKLDGE